MAITLVKDEKPARPFCEDCRWHIAITNSEGIAFAHHCTAPRNIERVVRSLIVRGQPDETIYRYQHCATHRNHTGDDVCGPEGRWFEPRTSEPTSHPSEEVAA